MGKRRNGRAAQPPWTAAACCRFWRGQPAGREGWRAALVNFRSTGALVNFRSSAELVNFRSTGVLLNFRSTAESQRSRRNAKKPLPDSDFAVLRGFAVLAEPRVTAPPRSRLRGRKAAAGCRSPRDGCAARREEDVPAAFPSFVSIGVHSWLDCFAAAHFKTQVSLLPPPWEEFTTSEPFRRATRVRPPGTIFTSFP